MREAQQNNLRSSFQDLFQLFAIHSKYTKPWLRGIFPAHMTNGSSLVIPLPSSHPTKTEDLDSMQRYKMV